MSSPAALSAGTLQPRFALPRPDEPGGAELLRLVDQVVEVLARIARAVRHDEPAHFAARLDRVAEDREGRFGERRRQVLQLHAGAQVGLVGSEARDRVGIRHPRKRRRRLASDKRHETAHQRLEDREDQILGRERDLEVDLRELRLPIGAQVLVAEALGDLEVAVHAGDHQDLLEDLRRLRQREELARVDAARHEIVARPFRRRLREDRRLDLEEALLVEVAADLERHLVPQDHVLLQPLAPQVEVAVAQPHLFGDRGVFVDRERRRLRVVQQPDVPRRRLRSRRS